MNSCNCLCFPNASGFGGGKSEFLILYFHEPGGFGGLRVQWTESRYEISRHQARRTVDHFLPPLRTEARAGGTHLPDSVSCRALRARGAPGPARQTIAIAPLVILQL